MIEDARAKVAQAIGDVQRAFDAMLDAISHDSELEQECRSLVAAGPPVIDIDHWLRKNEARAETQRRMAVLADAQEAARQAMLTCLASEAHVAGVPLQSPSHRWEGALTMGLLDNLKSMVGGKKGGKDPKAQAQAVAKELDDKAQELATKDGEVGQLAEKAHELLDKVDGD